MRPSKLYLLSLPFVLAASLRAQEDSPKAGTLDGHLYRNAYFAFSYRIPENLNVDTKRFEAEVEESVKGKQRTKTYVLFSAIEDTTLPKVRESVTVMADDASYYGGLADAGAYLRKVTKYHQGQGFKVIRDSVQSSYAGKRFVRADYTDGKSRNATYLSVAVTLWKGYAVTFIFATDNAEKMEQLVSSLKTLQVMEPASKH